MTSLSLNKDKIKILLLEGLHENAENFFKSQGYNNIISLKGALDEHELIEAIKDVHIIGIRSRTKLTKAVFEAAEKLMAVGCFCIGTNQVDLEAAKEHGIVVFNAPYSNTRSVAEVVVAEAVMLMRGIPQRNAAAHNGVWLKNADGAIEARGKTFGIVGYGHIGTQASILAEAVGMKVCYYDIEEKLALGNAEPCHSLEELLAKSDVVSLHVPQTKETDNLFSAKEFAMMKKGAFFINYARGSVVDIDALKEALDSKHIAGAAVDVFPVEPADKSEPFVSVLRGMDNVLLTPHIGGSTLEAQANIGLEVSQRLAKYSDNGSTLGAVNIVEVALPVQERGKTTRFMHIHKNVAGVLSAINAVFSDEGLNISGQYLRTDGQYAYVVIDIDGHLDNANVLNKKLKAVDGTLKVRYLI